MPYATIVFYHFALSYLIHCTMLLTAHICSYTLNHTEPKLKESMKQAQAKDLTNLALDQSKPQCIPPISLAFLLIQYLYVMLDCALSL
jgi:hypothetical protein